MIRKLEGYGSAWKSVLESMGQETYFLTLEKFMKGQDFVKISRAISNQQWNVALLTYRRMEESVKALGLDGLQRYFTQLRMAMIHQNMHQAQQAMVMITQKRVQLLQLFFS